VRLEELVPSCRTFNDIIAAKTFANRDKDREALPELLDIQERGCLAYRERHRSGIEFKMNDDPDRDIEPYVQADSTETKTRSSSFLKHRGAVHCNLDRGPNRPHCGPHISATPRDQTDMR
jgi:hypothetical protein